MKKYFLVCLSFLMFFSVLGTSHLVQAEDNVDSQKVKELAEVLEFIDTKATKKDSQGNIIAMNFDLIEEKYGEMAEIKALKEQAQSLNDEFSISEEIPSDVAYASNIVLRQREQWIRMHNACLKRELTNSYKEFISVSTITTLVQWIQNGQYTKAAKKLISLGVRGNVVALGATIVYKVGTCGDELKRKGIKQFE
ncbi:hypothetical protein WAG12_06230 [Bacillus cereus]|uniref:hypothetical protein n=1 Tax=Bacillus cereus group TaxID=86661 RepID=UPI002DBCA18D|nr:hypothetical protein [Bacillus tropicus]MEC2922194.1 hypothetical protein [Bacillus tropicus]MEC2925070.1 hypothetical protein [Bacillus tropicus]MEC2957513.1 hypothetical protein [Bacillus tropicus]MEC3048415.1 hypothetical protein [Bacillus tropicus]MEC3076184.1 hypothetical protein [Bacillus tropicus]